MRELANAVLLRHVACTSLLGRASAVLSELELSLQSAGEFGGLDMLSPGLCPCSACWSACVVVA